MLARSCTEHVINKRFVLQVFAHKWSPKDKDWWIVMPALESFSQPGEIIRYGTVIRLKHVKTRANLHSHPGFGSPSTGQQEVTAFGTNDRESDENDGETFILHHVVTKHTLHSHDIKLKHHDSHNEITAFDGKDENDKWVSGM
jgi:dolichyl-phosphate-mannose--protein O-mannosyl transferase